MGCALSVPWSHDFDWPIAFPEQERDSGPRIRHMFLTAKLYFGRGLTNPIGFGLPQWVSLTASGNVPSGEVRSRSAVITLKKSTKLGKSAHTAVIAHRRVNAAKLLNEICVYLLSCGNS